MSAGSRKRSSKEADHGPLTELDVRRVAAGEGVDRASRGMSTPLAMVSPSVPGIRGFTSSSAGRPCGVALALDVGDVGEAGGLGDRAAERGQLCVADGAAAHGDAGVDPGPGRGTGRDHVPLASASTSMEYSSPGRNSWTIRAAERSSAASSAAESDDHDAAGPAARPRLDDDREGPGARVEGRTEQLGARNADDPGASLRQRQLVQDDVKRLRRRKQKVDPRGGEGGARAQPAARARRRRSAAGCPRRVPAQAASRT